MVRGNPTVYVTDCFGYERKTSFYVIRITPTGPMMSDAPWVSDGQDGGLVGPQLALVGVRVVVLPHLAILKGSHT